MVQPHLSIDRFDIVVANEKDDDGKTKDIVKGHRSSLEILSSTTTIPYINGKKTNEPYLKDYIARLKDKLQSTYTGKGFEENGELLPPIGQYSPSFYSRQGWQS